MGWQVVVDDEMERNGFNDYKHWSPLKSRCSFNLDRSKRVRVSYNKFEVCTCEV